MRNYYDQACRYLARLRETSALLVSWLTSASGVRFVEWLDTRRVAWPGQSDRTGDTVARVADDAAGGVPLLVAIEFQVDPDADMAGRLLTYLGGLLTEYRPTDLPGDRYGVLAVVVNLRGVGNASRTMRLSGGPPDLFTGLGVREWNLQEQDAAAAVEAVARGDAPAVALAWVPLMRGGQDGTIIPRWREVADAEPRRPVREALRLAVVFADAVGCRDVWEAGLRGWNVEVPKVVQEWIDGGRAEGRVEGRVEGMRRSVLRVTSRRFGTVPADIEQRIRTADADTLDRYIDALMTATLEEFRSQL